MLEEKKSVKIAKRISSFQKIFVIAFLLSFVLLFIYCLGFATPFYDVTFVNGQIGTSNLDPAIVSSIVNKYCTDATDLTCGGVFDDPNHIIINLNGFVAFASEDIQLLNNMLFYFSIGGILISLLLYVYRAQIRKRYYITNYIVAGLCSVYSLVTCSIFFALFGVYEAELYDVNYELINAAHKILIRKESNFSKATFDYIYTLGRVVLVIMLVATVALILLHVMKFIAYKDFDKKHPKKIEQVEGGND